MAPEVVTSPAVTLTFEQRTATVTGLGALRYRRELVGRGRVLGVVFRPGCFRPLLGRPVETLTEQSVPAIDVFGPSVATLQSRLVATADIDRQIELLTAYFAPLIPAQRTTSEAVADLVDYMVTEPTLRGVGHLSRQLGLGRRRLGRIFADHVGVSPKWVLDRRALVPDQGALLGPAPVLDDLGRELAAA